MLPLVCFVQLELLAYTHVCFVFLQLKDKERQVVKDKFKVRL